MRDIALATKKDSSVMKTIAIVTMALLPATTVAALFSIPSLRWDQPVVVQERFWVYWVITIPLTVLVFLVAAVIGLWDSRVSRRGVPK